MSMKKRKVSDIQSVIMTVLSLMTVITSISMGLLLYNRYEMAMRQNEVRNTDETFGHATHAPRHRRGGVLPPQSGLAD